METVVPLQLRRMRRGKRVQLLMQLPPAAALLLQAGSALSGPTAARALALLQSGVAAAMLVLAIRELRGRGDGTGLGWVDLLAGGLLLTEWAASFADGGKLVSPNLLSGVAALVLGVLPLWMPEHRRWSLRLTEEGLAYRAIPLRRFRAAWGDLESVARRGGRLDLRTRGGDTRSLRMAGVENAGEVWSALAAAAARRGITVLDEAAPS